MFGLLLLTLAVTGMPRWESHAHAFDEIEHAHVHVQDDSHHDHDDAQPPDNLDDGASLTTHAHAAASLAVTLPTLAASTLIERAPDTWRPNRAVPTPPTAAAPPPYRPPIV